jgi:hypothetical protein
MTGHQHPAYVVIIKLSKLSQFFYCHFYLIPCILSLKARVAYSKIQHILDTFEDGTFQVQTVALVKTSICDINRLITDHYN